MGDRGLSLDGNPGSARPAALVAGCGDLGTRIGLLLAERGFGVWGLRRSGQVPAPLNGLRGDLTDAASIESALADGPRLFELVIYATAADAFDDAAYRRAYVDGVAVLGGALRARAAASGSLEAPASASRCIYISSTSVYGTSDASIVDESTPAEPPGFGGRRLLEGEEAARSLADHAVVLRLGGIYGPGRERLLRTVQDGSAVCFDSPPIWTNRIHVDDAARAAVHLASVDPSRLGVTPAIFLGVDDTPAPDGEVKRWLAARLGVPQPPPAVDGPSSTSRRMRSNKRCSNARLRATGFECLYPSYREGYETLIGDS